MLALDGETHRDSFHLRLQEVQLKEIKTQVTPVLDFYLLLNTLLHVRIYLR